MRIGAPEWVEIIREGAEHLDLQIDRAKAELFASHAVELIRWNQKFNLTAITDPFDVAVKHFLDSIASARWTPPGAELLDIGSGAGFPGIPLKIMVPSLSVTLVDSSRKKTSFLKHVARHLGLNNVEAKQMTVGKSGSDIRFSSSFDIVISRALSDLESFAAMAIPLVSKGGSVLAMKGKLSKEEKESLENFLDRTCGEKQFCLDVHKYRLPFLQAERSLISIRLKR